MLNELCIPDFDDVINTNYNNAFDDKFCAAIIALCVT